MEVTATEAGFVTVKIPTSALTGADLTNPTSILAQLSKALTERMSDVVVAGW